MHSVYYMDIEAKINWFTHSEFDFHVYMSSVASNTLEQFLDFSNR